eukprot:Partr_v1_DN27287_c0_g1_i2_m38379 putative GID complex subunit 4, VID24 homolog (S. cerevisiae)
MPSSFGLAPILSPLSGSQQTASVLPSPKSQELNSCINDDDAAGAGSAGTIHDDDAVGQEEDEEIAMDLENIRPLDPNCASAGEVDLRQTLMEGSGGGVIKKRPSKSAVSRRKISDAPLVKYKNSREHADGFKRQTTNAIDGLRISANGIGAFRPGARFVGQQMGARQSYEVSVDLKNVDLSNCTACGYIKIRGLTDEFAELTTYFDAELIGTKHSFLTRKWEADENVDRTHWVKFPGFSGLEDVFNRDDFSYDFTSRPQVFMRWKERFLVPDHRITTVNGASFAGFYYVCFDVASGTISGFYYHNNSEWFQKLHLEHVPQNSFGAFEFR